MKPFGQKEEDKSTSEEHHILALSHVPSHLVNSVLEKYDQPSYFLRFSFKPGIHKFSKNLGVTSKF
jgi:hypothetical protein